MPIASAAQCTTQPLSSSRLAPGRLTVSTRVVSRTILFLMRRTRSRLLVLICSDALGCFTAH
jgi:hypothetical protein